MKTLIETVNALPPSLVRALARTHRGHRPMGDTEVARRSGLSRQTIWRLAQRTSWNGVPVDTVERFCAACGVNILHPRRHLDYLRRKRKVAIRKSPRLIALLAKANGAVTRRPGHA